jgi:hypothetical protein
MRRIERIDVHATHRLGGILDRVGNGDIRGLDPLWATAIRSQEQALGHTQSRTHQSERKENTDNQKHSNHYRAAEEASAGSGPASPGPQILLTVGSPGS